MVVNGIDTKDISIVVQGAVDMSCTARCVQQLRNCFPGAEIILSTWTDSVVAGIDYDKLVLNKDPGGIKCSSLTDNTNRQIVSTKNGLKHCSKIYALKMRCDCLISSANMLTYWNHFPKRDNNYHWFNHRVIMPTLYCKRYLDQNSLIPVPFHYSDWLQFGFLEDIKKIWNIPLITDSNYYNWFASNKYYGVKLKRRWTNSLLTPESYIFSSAVKQSFSEIDYFCLADYSSQTVDFSEEILKNNFILVEPLNLDIIILKEPYRWQIENIEKFRSNQPDCLYSEKSFKKMYEEI